MEYNIEHVEIIKYNIIDISENEYYIDIKEIHVEDVDKEEYFYNVRKKDIVNFRGEIYYNDKLLIIKDAEMIIKKKRLTKNKDLLLYGDCFYEIID